MNSPLKNFPSVTCICVILILLITTIFPQAKFENITLRNGLPSNRVNDCTNDEYGFLWFTTDKGICRYDGVRFSVFNPDSKIGLSENVFHHVFVKSKDEILFLSYKGQLYSYSYSSGRFTNQSLSRKAYKDKFLQNILRDRNGSFWFTTRNGLIKANSQLDFLDEYLLKDYDKNPTVTNSIISICEDRKGILWLGMLSRAIFRFDPATGIFSNKGLEKILPVHQQVNSFYTFPNSKFIYASTGGEGVLRINVENLSAKKWRWSEANYNSLPSDRIQAITAQNDSILWIGTIDGLAKLNIRTEKITRYLYSSLNPRSLINNVVMALYIDPQNILWISTLGGISKLHLSPDRFTKISHDSKKENGISSNIVGHCLPDRFGNLWIGTSQGIDIKDVKRGNYYHYNLPKSFSFHKNEEVIKFFIDDDIMWIGTWGGGISRVFVPDNFKPGDKLQFHNFYNFSNDSKTISSNFTRSFAKDKQGSIWITTWNGGLNKIDSNEKRNEKISFRRFNEGPDHSKSVASNFIESILFDSYETLWLGTSNGLQKYNPESDQYEIFYCDPKNRESLINSSIFIQEDKNRNIWNASFSGLTKIKSTDGHNYTSEIIPESGKYGIFSMIIDGDNVIWFSTHDSKIGSYNPASGKLRFFSMIEEVGGFDFYLGAPTIGSDNNIYFVGNSGYLFFKKKFLHQNESVPPVYVTSVKVNDKEYLSDCDISLLKIIELDYEQRSLEINFAALNFIHPEENEYKYILDGQDQNWKSNGHKNEITFTNLPPGEYKLRIAGANNDGLWNTNEARLNIIIRPPIWQNTYARVIFFSMIAFTIYAYFNSKIKRLKEEKKRQHQLSKLLIESQEEERKRLSQELHDSLGQNLLVIKNQIDLYNSTEIKDASELDEISNLVKESIAEVKEISSNLHPHQLERLGLIKAVAGMIKKIESSANIEIESRLADISGMLTLEEEINIFRIIQESLNNIVKHSGSDKALVEFNKENGLISLTIEDFGKGFDRNDNSTRGRFTEGLGLKGIKERVRLLNGDLKIDSSPGKGTRILITIPKI